MRTDGPSRQAWWTLAAACLLLLLPLAPVVAASPTGLTVYFYDPALGGGRSATFERRVARRLQEWNEELRFEAFDSIGDLRDAIRRDPPDFLMVPPYIERDLGSPEPIRPLLIRERRRSPFQTMLLVGTEELEDLKGKTLAASGDAARPVVLDRLLLAGTGLRAEDLRILEVNKDVDAVLAVERGQVAGACVSESSVDLVARANPGVREKVSVLHTVEEVPLTALCAFGEPEEAKLEEARRIFGELHRSRDGKRLLRLLKADRMVEVDDALLEKLNR